MSPTWSETPAPRVRPFPTPVTPYIPRPGPGPVAYFAYPTPPYPTPHTASTAIPSYGLVYTYPGPPPHPTAPLARSASHDKRPSRPTMIMTSRGPPLPANRTVSNPMVPQHSMPVMKYHPGSPLVARHPPTPLSSHLIHISPDPPSPDAERIESRRPSVAPNATHRRTISIADVIDSPRMSTDSGLDQAVAGPTSRTSSMRDPPANETPGASPSMSPPPPEVGEQSGSTNRGKRRTKSGVQSEPSPPSPSPKRRRTDEETDPHLGPPPLRGRPAPIKTTGYGHPLGGTAGAEVVPSPVVMGFDFQSIDEDQLKTVRETISIREQQAALIAQRRAEAHISTPPTPRELTFKGWMPKQPQPSVGRRRDKTREKVERMSIVTSGDKDVMPGSKSAPLNHLGMSGQQSSNLPGSQTAVPPHLLPPVQSYGHPNGLSTELRTAPIPHTRHHPEEDHFPQPQFFRARPTYPEPPRHRLTIPAPRAFDPPNGHAPHMGHAPRPSLGGGGRSPSPGRREFLAPFTALYDLVQSTEGMRQHLQDLLTRSEAAYATQTNMAETMKATHQQATGLLGTLQASADSLKEMVRYEVSRAGSSDRRELEDLREKVRRLEEKVGSHSTKAASGSGSATGPEVADKSPPNPDRESG